MRHFVLMFSLGFMLVALGCFSGSGKKQTGDVIVKKSELRGSVKSADGQPQPGLTVRMLTNDNPVGTPAETDANGEFVFRNVPWGVFSIEVFGGEGFEPAKQAVRHDFSTDSKLVLPPIFLQGRSTRFTGRVVYMNSEGAEVPIVGAVVALIGTEDETRTIKEGRFTLSSSGIIEGIPYVLKVFAGSDFEPDVVRLSKIVVQGDNPVETVSLKPLAGVSDPQTRIPASYRPSDTGGTVIIGK